MRAVCSLLLVSALSASVTAYPNGAPRAACDSMHPVHGHKPQPGTGGYGVFPEPDFTGTRTKWTITLNGTSAFHGFLLEARSTRGGKIVGRWSHLPPRTKALDCDGVNGNAVTHHNHKRKDMNNISFTWAASSCKDAPVYFKATFVKHYTKIYEGITSDVLNDVCLRPPKCQDCDVSKAGRRKVLGQARARCRDAMRANTLSLRKNGGRSCRQDWDGLACWPETPAGGVARVPCPSYRPGLTGKGTY
ncbi:PTH2R [Branchiostoma lanceolatum]|uniref:PTH2R protein n=1 Tax=Branchiostoma lanceolatum TaxID=7740 RepID=A0A8J9W672_BRALA|nr:PTH2R [Branchiostoma lanceolatum]